MTANGSSSSATSRLELDLLAGGRLAPIPTALLRGRDLDLVAPLRFLAPGELPSGDPPVLDRSELAAALAAANADYGHPLAARLAERLTDPATRVVVTGQQPGLYGGPLLTVTKMAAAVLWAEMLTATGQSAVPVFWVASEDHDWKELTRTALVTREGPRRFDLGDDPAPLMPVGMRRFGAPIEELEQRIAAELGHELAAESFRLAGRWYRPEASFGDAFCRFMVHLLGPRAPLMLDAMLPAVKRLERPWLMRLIDRRSAVDEALETAGEDLRRRGYPLQVRPQPGASPLFLLRDDERRRIAWSGADGYSLRGRDDPPAAVDELRAIVEKDPARVSPGALARPAIQDALLGTTLQLMGAAELSYLAQAAALYPVLGIEPPWTALRPHAMLLEDRQIAHLEELDVTVAELLESSSERLLADKLGEDFVEPVRRRMKELIDDLRTPVVELDAHLERPWRKTRDQIDRALDQLSAKVAAAVARRHDVGSRRLGRLTDVCCPDGHLQERYLSVVDFLARFGPSFVGAFWSQLRLEPQVVQVIRITRGETPGGAES
ncbi:MAG: bacillithiol biosynthesis cysteine-adding enzyme BshC [bacterium]|nr:bacillithiol biosynthesis cysteine-adding enzyme BshC [bacterium]